MQTQLTRNTTGWEKLPLAVRLSRIAIERLEKDLLGLRVFMPTGDTKKAALCRLAVDIATRLTIENFGYWRRFMTPRPERIPSEKRLCWILGPLFEMVSLHDIGDGSRNFVTDVVPLSNRSLDLLIDLSTTLKVESTFEFDNFRNRLQKTDFDRLRSFSEFLVVPSLADEVDQYFDLNPMQTNDESLWLHFFLGLLEEI